MSDTFRELRTKIDSNDPFMTGGHRLLKMRRHQRSVPEWVRSDETVRKVLLRSFPKLQTDDRQRKRAAVWTRIIHLYMRLGYTYSYVADEMGLSHQQVRSIVQRMYYVSDGKNSKTGGAASQRPAGRPKRNPRCNSSV